MRVGIGYDVHQLVEGRKLILGGVDVPYGKGLLGHSDADVLVHAIMDSLLGAAALGSIGDHFPDTDMSYKGISSMALLEYVNKLIQTQKYRINNIDATIVAQAPKLAGVIPEMCYNVARVLGVEQNQISVKATTTEHLGFAGRGEGISAYAVCLLENI
ncbi:MAG: 2-C-methyl-D-erythritol 2,4-cyclodiphosphate synthase [Candidatus Margulisiibacteriota bacterium]|jgi:2-C-methyl-D-erythritol 2,4-cyclodiphosphate synthase